MLDLLSAEWLGCEGGRDGEKLLYGTFSRELKEGRRENDGEESKAERKGGIWKSNREGGRV